MSLIVLNKKKLKSSIFALNTNIIVLYYISTLNQNTCQYFQRIYNNYLCLSFAERVKTGSSIPLFLTETLHIMKWLEKVTQHTPF